MIREIVFDTETTGFDPEDGHRIVEIGAIEMVNHLPTGRIYHVYLNPERDIPADATAIHGITNEKVKDCPVFAQEFINFLDFIGTDSKLVAHNATFDMNFINYQLKMVGHPGIKPVRVVDSLMIARKKYPGAPASLDALCRRFDIDLSGRTYHGALLDAELLGNVWLELNGGRQHGFDIDSQLKNQEALKSKNTERIYREPRKFVLCEEEFLSHNSLLSKIKDPIWGKIKNP